MSRAGVVGRMVLLSLVAMAACEGDATNQGNNNNSGSISLTLSVGTLSIAQGGNGQVTVTVGRTGSFTGAIAIALEGVPANVTASASPTSIGAGATNGTITFTAASSAAATNTTVTIRASGSGVTDQTRTLTLTVTAVAQPSYSLVVAPGALSIAQGAQSSQATATLTRTGGFTGSVAFSHTGAPNGVTITFNPTSTTGNTTTITVAVGAAVAPNNYTITIRGTATGLTDQTATLTVTVTASGGGGNTTFRFCPPIVALFAAFQDGNGPWTAVPITNNAITFNLASGRGGVAYVHSPNPNAYATVIFYGTQAELNAGTAQCPALPATKSVNGSVANVGAGESAFVGLSIVLNALPPGTTNFTLQGVHEGVTDLIATRVAQVIGAQGITQTANKGIIRRGLNPAAGSTLPVLDFNAAEAFNPVTRNLTLNNLGTDLAIISESFRTSNGASSVLYSDIQLTAGVANRQIPTVPNPQTGDLHLLGANAGAFAGGQQPTTLRGVLGYFTASADRTLTFGPNIGAVTVTTAATAPNARLRTQYTVQPEYNKGIAINYSQSSGGSNRTIVISLTGAYIGGTAALDHTQPDFAALTGWNVIWGLVQGAVVQWSLTGVNFTTTNQGDFLDGAITTLATRLGSITP